MVQKNSNPRRYRYEIAAAISLTVIAVVLLAVAAIGDESSESANGSLELNMPASIQ